jgi:hypothetical protein
VGEVADPVLYTLSDRPGIWRIVNRSWEDVGPERRVVAWLNGRKRALYRDDPLEVAVARGLGRSLVSDADLLFCDACGRETRTVLIERGPAGDGVICRTCAAG